jgi:hypothetical protein
MRRDIFTALRFLIYPTLAVLGVAAFLPGRLELVVRIYALLLCAVTLVLVVAALRRAYPPATPLRHGPGQRGGSQRPGTLARLEHLCALGTAGSFDLHHHLRPRLRSIAGGLLTTRRRISLDAEPDAARAALGAEAYDVVRQDRPPPVDRLARGLPVAELDRIVESLERV